MMATATMLRSTRSAALVMPPTLVGLRRHLRHLQRESRQTARTVAQLKAIFVAQGQAFGYQSAQALTADEAARYWQNRYRALASQMDMTRALYVSVLFAQRTATSAAMKASPVARPA